MKLRKQQIIKIFSELKKIINSDNDMLFYGSTHITEIIIREEINISSNGDTVAYINFEQDLIYEYFTDHEETIDNYIEEMINTFCSYSPNKLVYNIKEKHDIKSI